MQPGNLSLSIIRGIIFGPYQFQCLDIDNNPVDLTNWKVWAYVKEEPESTLILDLQAVITDALHGMITIPEILDEQTILMEDLDGAWDMIFQLPTGERIGPFVAGSFTISSIITEPPEGI